MEVVLIILFVVIGLVMLSMAYLLIKNSNTCEQRTRIDTAIFRYRLDCIGHGVEARVTYDDMEEYEQTLYRIFDWSYKKILPKEKFELIKDFII